MEGELGGCESGQEGEGRLTVCSSSEDDEKMLALSLAHVRVVDTSVDE